MARKFVAIIAATTLALPTLVHGQRQPLAVQPLTRIEHDATAPRHRWDSVRGTMTEYEVTGKIEYLPASGNFLLSWNGLDGSRQEMIWEPPNKLSAVIAGDVTLDSGTGLYTYSYTVSNLTLSAQKLKSVYIGAGAIIDHAAPPDDTWYSRPFTPFLRTTFATGGWGWSQVFGSDGIVPGQTMSGFQLTSRRPPGIVKVYVEGWRPPLQSAEDPPEELHAAIDRVYFRLPAGVTIGPAATDVPQTAQAQLDSLLSLLSEAERQGWLGTSASARNVRSSVTAIRASIVRADTIRAREQASTLLRDLHTPQYEGVLSEGRALIEFRLPLQLR